MAGTINVSGVFVFTVAASNAIYNEVTCNLAAIKMSAYNVQEQAVVFSFKKVDGDSKTALTAYPTLTVYNKSGVVLVEQKPAAGTSISYTIPVNSLATADRVMVRIYSDAARTKLLAESAAISVVRENPMPFPKGEAWNVEMVLKNGEMLILDNVVYMWSSPVSGNSKVHPKTDIANNPSTTYWVSYQDWPLLCTNMMIARLALIGKAVFYDEYMFSQHGTDAAGNPSANYQGFANGTFKPNLLLNFLTGDVELSGKLTAKENSQIAGMRVIGNSLRGVQAIMGIYKHQISGNGSVADRDIIVNNILQQQTYLFSITSASNDIQVRLPSHRDMIQKGIEQYQFEITIVLDNGSTGSAILFRCNDDALIVHGLNSFSTYGLGKGGVLKLLYFQNRYYLISNSYAQTSPWYQI